MGLTRTPAQVLDELVALSPSGIAWSDSPASVWRQHLLPLADMLSAEEATMAALVAESDIRNADNLLPDYEAALGPDPVGRDGPGATAETRRLVAWQRWTTRGPRTPAFFIATAAKLGVTVTIDELLLCECGVAECGDDLAIDPEQYVWRMDIQAADLTVPPYSGLVALVQRLNPPHMTVCFQAVG